MSRGLTLSDFEKLSGGRIKSVVLGSYERGTRAISLARLVEIAAIYQVSVQYFLSGKNLQRDERERELWIFDLRRIAKMGLNDEVTQTIVRYIRSICEQRSDWNGEVLSLRKSDGELLSAIFALSVDELGRYLKARELILR